MPSKGNDGFVIAPFLWVHTSAGVPIQIAITPQTSAQRFVTVQKFVITSMSLTQRSIFCTQ